MMDDSKVERLREILINKGIASVLIYNIPLAVEIYCLLCKNKYTLQEAKQLLREVEMSLERMINFSIRS